MKKLPVHLPPQHAGGPVGAQIGTRIVGSRLRPTQRPPLSLKHYIRGEPAPPTSISYASKAPKSLAQMYGNDQHGDCIYAMAAHWYGLITGNAGAEQVLKDAQVLADYGKVTGYKPGKPSTDVGGTIPDAIAFYTKAGSSTGLQVLGSASIDAADPAEMRLAAWLFEGLWFGGELPDKCVTPFPAAAGFVWDKSGKPDPENGHAFLCTGYNGSQFEIDTWGMLGYVTDAFAKEVLVAKAYGEVHAVISAQMIAKGQSVCPNGIAWDELIADLNEVGGNVPTPDPVPAPQPAPAPSPTGDTAYDLARAQAALAAGWPLV